MFAWNADRIVDQLNGLLSLASTSDTGSFIEPISQVLQAPMTLFSVASGMLGSIALFWWNRQKSLQNAEAFDHLMSDRLEEMRDHEAHLPQ
ncbi:hypothetical protein GC170_15945 [bacterium]|nr:hypothetical protein [bacterium]